MGFESGSVLTFSLLPSRSNSIDNGCESGSDGEQEARGVARPRSQEIPAAALETISKRGLLDAFSETSPGTWRALPPKDLFAMRRSNRLLAELVEDDSFWKPWGYEDIGEATRLLGLLDENGNPDENGRKIFAPVCRWARDGRIDKAQFLHILNEYDLKKFFALAHKEQLSDEELWKVTELEAELSTRHWSDLAGTVGGRMLLIPYAQGKITLEHLNAIEYQSKTHSLAVANALFDAGALSQEWKNHLGRLKNGADFVVAVCNRIDPRLYDALTSPGNGYYCRWDPDRLRDYYGVDDLSQVAIMQEDSDRCDTNFGGWRRNIPDTVENRVSRQRYELDDHDLLTEVGRRLQRQRQNARAQAVRLVTPPTAATAKPRCACVLF